MSIMLSRAQLLQTSKGACQPDCSPSGRRLFLKRAPAHLCHVEWAVGGSIAPVMLRRVPLVKTGLHHKLATGSHLLSIQLGLHTLGCAPIIAALQCIVYGCTRDQLLVASILQPTKLPVGVQQCKQGRLAELGMACLSLCMAKW